MKYRNAFFLVIAILIVSCSTEHEYDNGEKTLLANSEGGTQTPMLRWMGHWHGEGKKEQMIKEIARDFSFLNQDIDLNLEFPDQIFNVTSDKLYAIQSDSIANMVRYDKWPFDILFCDLSRYSNVGNILKNPSWGKENLVDFSQESWFEEAHKPNIFKDIDYKSVYGGIIPGPLLEGFANVLYTSTYVEKLLGIDVKKYDMTITDFESYAKAVYDYNKNHTDKIYFYSKQYWSATALLYSQLAMSAYGKLEKPSKQDGLDVLKRVYEALEQLSKYNPIEQNEKANPGSRELMQDKYLFTISPSWMYILWQMSNPAGLTAMEPAELPSFENQKSPIYSGGYNVVFVVPKHAKNLEAAKKLIRSIASSEVAMKWSKYSKCPTALRSSLSYTDFGQDSYTKYYKHIQEKYGNNQQEISIPAFFFNKQENTDLKFEDVLSGKLSANDALKQVLKQL